MDPEPEADETFPAAPTALERAIAQLRRRMVALLAVAGTGNALALIALLLGVAILAARLARGVVLNPAWWWLVAAGPAVLWGLQRARRELPSPADLALHLDRQLGLRGLALAGFEEGSRAWDDALTTRLRDLRPALPNLDLQALLGRVAAAALFLAVCALLPPPPTAPKPKPNAAIETALGGVDQELKELLEAAALPEEAQKELQQRLKELQAAMASGKPPSWSDLDALEDRIAHEMGLRTDALAGLLGALQAAQQTARGRGGARTGTPGTPGRPEQGSPEDKAAAEEAIARNLARALETAERTGLLHNVPEALRRQLRRRLRRPSPTATPRHFDPQEGLDTLQGLAQRLQQALEQVSPEELERLRQLGATRRLNRLWRHGPGRGQNGQGRPGGKPSPFTQPGHLEQGAGAPMGGWGVSRGPGTAPFGRGPGATGQPIGGPLIVLPRREPRREDRPGALIRAERTEPEEGPTRDMTAGREGIRGEATATRAARLGPAHRAVVRRYFTSEGKEQPTR